VSRPSPNGGRRSWAFPDCPNCESDVLVEHVDPAADRCYCWGCEAYFTATDVDDVVWYATGTVDSGPTNVYHTDRDCYRLDRADEVRTIARGALAEPWTQCRTCAGRDEAGHGAYETLLEADPEEFGDPELVTDGGYRPGSATRPMTDATSVEPAARRVQSRGPRETTRATDRPQEETPMHTDTTDEPTIYCLDCETATPCECVHGPTVVAFQGGDGQ
jgi:hypothetical protein